MLRRNQLVLAGACATIGLFCTMPAEAQLTSIRWENVDNTVNDDPDDNFDPSQYVTNDLVIDFLGQYTGMQLLVELTQGSIFQHDSPLIGSGTQPPVAALLQVDPTLIWDTFTAQGGPTWDDTIGNFGLGGGAVGVGGAPAAQFDTEGINQGWNPAGGVIIVDQSDFMVARVTLTDDAMGTWAIKTGTGLMGVTKAYGQIAHGEIGFLDFAGDYDGNRSVSQHDLDRVLLNWGRSAEPAPDFWYSNLPSGLVSQNELDAVLLNWGNSYMGVDSVAIPEPGSLALALLVVLAMAIRTLPQLFISR